MAKFQPEYSMTKVPIPDINFQMMTLQFRVIHLFNSALLYLNYKMITVFMAREHKSIEIFITP